MNINKYIDHTNLKPYASKKDIEKLCDEAMRNNFVSVCVNPYYVGLAHELLIRSCVKVCTVVGFPLGQNTTAVKSFEAKMALDEGADEIDMVINISALKDGNYNYVLNEIKEIRNISKNNIFKVIIETCYLNKEEIVKATEICNEAKVDFIKTSTGYGVEGAKLEGVELIMAHKDENIEIKASGGIKNYEHAKAFIDKGVTRIGTSNGIKIMEEM